MRVGDIGLNWLLRRIMETTSIRLHNPTISRDPMPTVVISWLSSSYPLLYKALLDLSPSCPIPEPVLYKACAMRLPAGYMRRSSTTPTTVGGRQGPIINRVTRSFWYVQIRPTKRKAHVKWLNRLFPSSSKTDNSHMTQHLSDMVITLQNSPAIPGANMFGEGEDVPKTTLRGMRLTKINEVLATILVGSGQLITLGALAAYMGLPGASSTYMTSCMHKHILVGDWKQQLTRLKSFSQCLRKCSRDLDGNTVAETTVSALAYQEILFGRSGFVSDWAQEYANRCGPTFHPQAAHFRVTLGTDRVITYDWRSDESCLNSQQNNPDFYRRLWRRLVSYAKILVKRRGANEDFESFWSRRHEWIAGGSSSGYTVDVRDANTGGIVQSGIKGQKRAWAEGTTFATVDDALNGRPAEIARASEKFENGKARAIYGVDPIHYTINTYATKGFEERLHNIPGLEKGASGLRAVQLEMNRASITADPEIECSMLDYADFNRHHTPEAQAMIFDAFAQVGERVGVHPDWVKANKWVAQATAEIS